MTPFDSSHTRCFMTGLVSDLSMPLTEYLLSVFEAAQGIMDADELEQFTKRLGHAPFPDCDMLHLAEEEDYPLSTVTCYMVWAAGCLLEQVFCGADWSGECRGYADEYLKAADMLRAESEKRRFLSRKPVYDTVRIIQECIDALDYVTGIETNSGLAADMISKGCGEEFEDAVTGLQTRLCELI